MPDSSLAPLAAAFAVSWFLFGIYLIRLWRAQRDLARRLGDLEGRGGVSKLG